MPEEKQISLIIPVLNEEKLLWQTLSQFTPEIKQKFGIEVIVSDGGSTDKTLSIAESLSDKVVVSGKGTKQNIAIGRNLGTQAAKGKYFYIMNGDTRIADIEQFFAATLAEFENSNIAALTCRVKVFPKEEKTADKLFHFTYNNYVRILNAIGMGMGRGECHIIRKEVFLKAKGYNEKMAAGEDYDLYRRIAKSGKIKYIGTLTVYESPRRYRRYGYGKVFWAWTKNAVSVFVKNKAISQEWEQIR